MIIYLYDKVPINSDKFWLMMLFTINFVRFIGGLPDHMFRCINAVWFQTNIQAALTITMVCDITF